MFHDKVKFKQHLPTNLALKKVIERELKPKEVNYINENTAWNMKTQQNQKKGITLVCMCIYTYIHMCVHTHTPPPAQPTAKYQESKIIGQWYLSVSIASIPQ